MDDFARMVWVKMWSTVKKYATKKIRRKICLLYIFDLTEIIDDVAITVYQIARRINNWGYHGGTHY